MARKSKTVAPRSKNKDGSTRKRRSDTNHVVYLVTCATTGDTYVGITYARGRAFLASAYKRWLGHCSHALAEGRPYRLHEAIRTHGADAFEIEVLRVIRGKALAHEAERILINLIKPSLNVECTDRKMRSAARRASKS